MFGCLYQCSITMPESPQHQASPPSAAASNACGCPVLNSNQEVHLESQSKKVVKKRGEWAQWQCMYVLVVSLRGFLSRSWPDIGLCCASAAPTTFAKWDSCSRQDLVIWELKMSVVRTQKIHTWASCPVSTDSDSDRIELMFINRAKCQKWMRRAFCQRFTVCQGGRRRMSWF